MNIPADDMAYVAMKPENLASFGLNFIIRMRDQILLGSENIIEEIFKAIFRITKKEVEPPSIQPSVEQ